MDVIKSDDDAVEPKADGDESRPKLRVGPMTATILAHVLPDAIRERPNPDQDTLYGASVV
jgi:hypothetical protein